MSRMRRLRGVLRTAMLWGVAWSIPGLVWISSLSFRRGAPPFRLLSVLRDVVLNWTMVGAISGAAFALILIRAERRQASIGSLSMRRVTAWGAIGGATLPVVLTPIMLLPSFASAPNPLSQVALTVGAYGILGAASAAISLHLARREPLSQSA